jgi:hypothetical protein
MMITHVFKYVCLIIKSLDTQAQKLNNQINQSPPKSLILTLESRIRVHARHAAIRRLYVALERGLDNKSPYVHKPDTDTSSKACATDVMCYFSPRKTGVVFNGDQHVTMLRPRRGTLTHPSAALHHDMGVNRPKLKTRNHSYKRKKTDHRTFLRGSQESGNVITQI